jgi:hypothetical protein
MDITQIAQLAKQGGRLASDKQWVLADALAELTPTQISQVSVESGRNESTLLQYARAAERWDKGDRVEGVSFSAHRVVLSWHEPRELLIELKHQYGSPTVSQVRKAMGLEGHPALELLERGIKKIDRQVSQDALARVILKLNDELKELTGTQVTTETKEQADARSSTGMMAKDMQEIPVWKDEDDNEIPVTPETVESMERKGTWQPPVRTSDVAGI